MRRLVTALPLALALAACASPPPVTAGGAPAAPAPVVAPEREERSVVAAGTTGGTVMLRLLDETEPTRQAVLAPPAVVHRALLGAFAQLGVEVNRMDTPNGLVAAEQVRAPHRMDGRPRSTFVDCGRDPVSGAMNADTYSVWLTVLAIAAPGPQGTSELTVAVGGSALRSGTQVGQSVRCSTTGRLERRIVELVNERIRA